MSKEEFEEVLRRNSEEINKTAREFEQASKEYNKKIKRIIALL